MRPITFISTGFFIVIAACTMQKDNKMSQSPLYATKWGLKKVYDQGKQETVDTKAFIRFNKEKNSAGGNGSCNSFGSSAMVQGNKVTFKDIFSTKMYCEDVSKTESIYFNNLAKVSRYEIKKDTLFLYEKDILVLEFHAIAEDIKPGT